MLEQLQQVDTSVIEELMAIKRERETVAERLARMTGEQGKVSDVVFRRVRGDYEAQANALEKRAAPLKQRARQEYARLKSELDRIESGHAAARLDREELDFRNHLGEFAPGEFEKKAAELDAQLAAHAEELEQAARVKASFVAAFDSEAELMLAGQEAAPPPTPVATAPATGIDVSAITAPQPIEPPPGETTPPPPAPPASESAAPPPPPPEEVAAPPAPDVAVGRTVVMSLARLVAVDNDLGSDEFALEPLTFVGRTPDNQVRLNKPAVSRRHAQLTQTDKGWTIKDLQSETGSYVNGEKITERQLFDGDKVQIGTVRLVFRTA